MKTLCQTRVYLQRSYPTGDCESLRSFVDSSNSDGGEADGGRAPPQAQQLQGDAAKPKSVLEKLVREPQLGEQQTHGYTHLNHQLCLHGKFGPFPAGSMFLVPGDFLFVK